MSKAQEDQQVTKQIFALSGNKDGMLDEKLKLSKRSSSSSSQMRESRAHGLHIDNAPVAVEDSDEEREDNTIR
jgi:hypothetical protein